MVHRFLLAGLFVALLLPRLQAGGGSTGWQEQINYQGQLTNLAGTAVADGSHSVVFSIYDQLSGGNLIWSETQPAVVTTSGLFNIALGSVLALPLSTEAYDLYLTLNVDGDGEMSPRQPLVSAVSALRAVKANSADNATSANYASTAGSASSATNATLATNATTAFNALSLSGKTVGNGTLQIVATDATGKISSSVLPTSSGYPLDVAGSSTTYALRATNTGTGYALSATTSSTTLPAAWVDGAKYGLQVRTQTSADGIALEAMGPSGSSRAYLMNLTKNALVYGYAPGVANIPILGEGTHATQGVGVAGLGGFVGVSGAGGTYGVYGISALNYGVYGTSTSGTGAYGISSSGNGVYAQSTSANGLQAFSSSGSGVYSTGSAYGVQGHSSATSGIGVLGNNSTGTSGYGVRANALGTNGVGLYATGAHTGVSATGSVFGMMIAATGTSGVGSSYGGTGIITTGQQSGLYSIGSSYGAVAQTTGTAANNSGLYGYASATSGATFGVNGQTYSTTNFASGVRGTASGATGTIYGVYGSTSSTDGGAYGVYGTALAGVKGIGVYGDGSSKGVYGNGTSYGVYGNSIATGVYGIGAIGVEGYAESSNTVAVKATQADPNGLAIYAWQYGNGDPDSATIVADNGGSSTAIMATSATGVGVSATGGTYGLIAVATSGMAISATAVSNPAIYATSGYSSYTSWVIGQGDGSLSYAYAPTSGYAVYGRTFSTASGRGVYGLADCETCHAGYFSNTSTTAVAGSSGTAVYVGGRIFLGSVAGTLTVSVTTALATTSTLTSNSYVNVGDRVLLTPTKDLGASARYYLSATANGSFTVTVTNAAVNTYTFNYLVVGD